MFIPHFILQIQFRMDLISRPVEG